MAAIDLNADAGEAFGPWKMGMDEELFPLVSSVNLACGFHAGDPLTILASVRRAVQAGASIGAHPGFPDLVGFGRRDLDANPDDVYADVAYQVGALRAMAALAGAQVRHVKPHGALYNRMARDVDVARAVAQAVQDLSPSLRLVVLAGAGGATMRAAAAESGVVAVLEAFPDRAYLPDGRLAPRSQPGALVRDPLVVARRAVRMAAEGRVDAIDGTVLPLQADTLCVHGDNRESVAIAAAIRHALAEAGVQVRAF